MAPISQDDCRNLLLRHLSPADFASLSPDLEWVEYVQREELSLPDQPIEHVYFPETGVASITSGRPPAAFEIGVVGREGFVGLAVILSDGTSATASTVQMPGCFLRMPAERFRAAVRDSPSILSLVLRYVQAYTVQVSSTAISNGTFNVEQRLARWLLMASDRIDGSELCLTHDLLAMMLGVRRPGITVATHVLEGEHAIRATRGRIHILSRSKLRQIAGRSYGLAEAEYERVTGITTTNALAAFPDRTFRVTPIPLGMALPKTMTARRHPEYAR